MSGEIKSKNILKDLKICDFTQEAEKMIDQFMNGLQSLRPGMKPQEIENIKEFIYLGAAEAAIIRYVAESKPSIVVEGWEAVISVLKGDTTYGMGCPPPGDNRIRDGRLLPEDIFLYHGDYQKFLEFKCTLEDVRERPFYVAKLFLGEVPKITDFAAVANSKALPIQSLLWKFKLDIINLKKTITEELAWYREIYNVETRLDAWP